jgi:phosphomannomutase
MIKEAQFTISGLRGVWGENLNESIAKAHIEAFAIFLQERKARKIILGRDARESGPIIGGIAKEILIRAGFEVVDAGIIPTPTIIFLIRTMQFDGGIMLTASHNPREYNGIKFLTKEAFYANQKEVNEIKSYLGEKAKEEQGGNVKEDNTLGVLHVKHVIDNVNKDLIASKKYKVVIDTINGAGCYLGPMLLEELGCEVVPINNIPDGNFAHIPEPLPENLIGLGEKAREAKADIGFAQDPDADRLVVCDEKGEIIFEEYTLSLAIKSVLKNTPGDIVTNLSTSNTNEDLVKDVSYKNYRTKVGEGNVVAGIIEHKAVIGGEGGGGVIYPKVNLCRDSLTGMALILESLAQEDKKISEIVATLPKYEFIKTKMPFSGNINEAIEKIIKEFQDGTPDTQDGLRLDFADRSWLQIRASNTEPIIRIFAEAKTKDRALDLIKKTEALLYVL